MRSNIQTLPDDVVNLMAAGEVIDSLAAVVRELAENALDAGATRITVYVWMNQWRVRVADNGSGMTITDLQHAARSHSTSKIRASSDLWKICSLGFRGEALHSLTQLANLEICSRPIDHEDGWCVRYNSQGETEHLESIAIAPGTVVTVSNVFGNWLPRRHAMPPTSQQLRSLQLTIQHLALCHPHVTWQVYQNDRDWFSIWNSSSAKQILSQLLRDIQPSDLHEVELESPEWGTDITPTSHTSPTLRLLIGLPDRCHRHRPDWIKVAVNGRVVKVAELEQTILASFRRLLPRDRYPVCFLHLSVPLEWVDWNRHPAKAEIYLHHRDQLQQFTATAIDRALQFSSANLADSAHATRVKQLIKTAEATGDYGLGNLGHDRTLENLSLDELEPHTPNSQPQASNENANPDANQDPNRNHVNHNYVNRATANLAHYPLKAIAQVHNMYILAEHPTGMWLVEQHIAHERVLYEQLRDRWQLVSLESPIILDRLSAAQLTQLQRIGIEADPFGEYLWAIRTVPDVLATREDCMDAVMELSLGGDLDAALVATACRTAIRNGTPLSHLEMQSLLNQWQNTRNPRTCPHGRPIYLPLEESSLSRFFRRHWVIGKSHGI